MEGEVFVKKGANAALNEVILYHSLPHLHTTIVYESLFTEPQHRLASSVTTVVCLTIKTVNQWSVY